MSARADNDSYSVMAKMGPGYGLITEEKGNEIIFAGLVVAGGIERVFSDDISAHVQGHIVFDMVNSQIARKGVELGTSYYLLGGPRLMVSNFSSIGSKRSYRYGLSILARAGYQNYSISDSDPLKDQSLQGQILQFKLGLAFRYERFGLEFVSTIYGMPAGVERLTDSGGEILFFYEWNL